MQKGNIDIKKIERGLGRKSAELLKYLRTHGEGFLIIVFLLMTIFWAYIFWQHAYKVVFFEPEKCAAQ